ncbi:MAG TPA: 1-deoxy-D-xylulose-5-phosphate reductoisomerase [Candidatus Tyrphobacter sp.]
MKRKRVAILGSTGSIGTQALDVIARFPERFEVVALAAGRNVERLREQAHRFECAIATSAQDGSHGLHRVAVESEPDVVLAATDGAVAFDAVFAAVERGIDVAVANKELIVAAGDLLTASAKRSGAQVLPVDSEHSAIFQCLIGERPESIARILLTASGGPFLHVPREEMENAGVDAALAHPTWRMGKKNTIDSATMMNKGLEVIEASRLFGVEGERIGVVIHPQSIVHGFVLFTDGSVKAQLAAPDMRLPIGYALAYPDRLTWSPFGPAGADPLTLIGARPQTDLLRYEYERPDFERFPCLRLAYEALARGGTAPAVLSAANEVAVEAFIEERLRFGEIPALVERVLGEVEPGEPTLDGVRDADRRARALAERIVGKVTR